MGLLGLAIVSVTLGITLIAKDVPTGDSMLSTFQAGQSFYSEGAYDQAIEKYRSVGDVTSKLLDDGEIIVVVGEVEATVKDAAIYQVGNSYFKMFEEQFQAAEASRNESQKAQRASNAQDYLEKAVSYFSRVEQQSRSEELRVLAKGRVMTCWYTAERFEDVIREGREFVERYPDHPYLVEALYNIGWSYYELGSYDQSIEAFSELTRRFDTGFQVSRALFQIGECYYDQGLYAEAIPHYQRLVERTDLHALSEQDVQRMQFEKVAGLVDETEYELTAKAQIRTGDCYSQLEDFDQAEQSYRTVVTVFSQERRLVEKAYQSLADMYFENRQLTRCVGAYREAIDNTPNKTFQARMQFRLAQRYTEASREWDEDHFDDAIREYNVYMKGYDDVAAAAGFSLANTWYEIGQVHYARAERLARNGESISAQDAYNEALQAYTLQLAQHPDPLFDTATRFNAALSRQMIGTEEETRAAVADYQQIIEQDAGGTYARSSQFQVARIQFGQQAYDESAATYARIISGADDPTHLDIAHFELGLVYGKAKNLRQATEHLLLVRDVAPQFSLSRLEAARAYVGLSDFDNALQVLERGSVSAPNDAERAQYRYLAGKAWVGKENYLSAVEAFSQTIETTPDPILREIAQYDRGTSYSRLEQYAEAARDLAVLVGSDNERIRVPAQKMLGMAYLRMNKQAEALQSYSQLASASQDPAERVEYLVLILELYLELEQYDMAIATGRQVLQMEFDDSKENRDYWIREQVYYLIAESQQRGGQHDDAISTYSEGLQRYPDSFYSPDMAYALGTLYFQKDQLDEAAETLSNFVSRFGDSANALYGYYYLGYAHFNLRDFERAGVVFKELVGNFPNSEVAPEAMMRAAESAFNLGAFDEVVVLYRQLLDAYPDSPFGDEATYNMAWAFYEAKNEDEFVEGLGRLLRAFPDSEFAPDARFTLGDYFFNREEYAKALAEYQFVMQDYADSKIAKEVPEVLQNVREIIAYGEYEQAMVIFSEALSLEKESKKAEAVAKFREVVPLFVGIMERYPNTEVEVGALSNLGVCYEFQNQWKDAVQTYDRVITLFEAERASQEAYQFAKGHRDWIVTSRL
jgi:tetratricopeptide (TPR) repeat protein